MNSLIDSPFITLNYNEAAYNYQSLRKRKFAQNNELMRVYYTRANKSFFAVMTTKTKRMSVVGTFTEIYNLAEQIMEDYRYCYLHFAYPTTFPQSKIDRLNKLLAQKDAELSLLKNYLLLLI